MKYAEYVKNLEMEDMYVDDKLYKLMDDQRAILQELIDKTKLTLRSL